MLILGDCTKVSAFLESVSLTGDDASRHCRTKSLYIQCNETPGLNVDTVCQYECYYMYENMWTSNLSLQALRQVYVYNTFLSFYVYIPISEIPNLPQEALQSVQHTTPLIQTKKNGRRWKKPPEEQKRRDPSPTMNRHAIDVVCTK